MTMEHNCKTGHHKEPSPYCYSNHKCRCEGCLADHAQYFRDLRNRRPPRSDKARRSARNRFHTWAMEHHKDIFDKFYAEEYNKLTDHPDRRIK